MRLGVWVVLGLGLGWLGACGKASTGDQVGGETHWLKQCAASSECGPDLECLCGVCTSGCDDDAACSELGAARCSARSDSAYGSACTNTEPERLCVREASSEPEVPIVTPLPGRRYDESANCLLASEVAGTIQSSEPLSCDDAITYAIDGASCWQFPSSCLPEGFTALELPLIGSSCAVAGPCEDAATCADGQVSTPDGCLACDAAYGRLWGDVSDLMRENGWDDCNADLDCDLVPWSFGCFNNVCGTALAASSTQSFLDGASEIVAQHCSDPGDWTRRCPQAIPDCTGPGAICRQGRCVASSEPPCADRPLESCEADGDCALASAFPFDAGQQCFDAATIAVGCIDPDLSCPPVVTAALDGDGNCFLFGNCLPPGFERAPEGHACTAALGTTCSN